MPVLDVARSRRWLSSHRHRLVMAAATVPAVALLMALLWLPVYPWVPLAGVVPIAAATVPRVSPGRELVFNWLLLVALVGIAAFHGTSFNENTAGSHNHDLLDWYHGFGVLSLLGFITTGLIVARHTQVKDVEAFRIGYLLLVPGCTVLLVVWWAGVAFGEW